MRRGVYQSGRCVTEALRFSDKRGPGNSPRTPQGSPPMVPPSGPSSNCSAVQICGSGSQSVERQRAAATEPAPSLGATLPLDSPDTFYRLLSVEPPAVAKLGTGGAEVFGYGDAFAESCNGSGRFRRTSLRRCSRTAPNYLPGISWDPTTAQFWDQFNADPNVVNQDKQPRSTRLSVLRCASECTRARAIQNERLRGERAAGREQFRRCLLQPLA